MTNQSTPTDAYLSDILSRCDAQDAGEESSITTTDVRGLVELIRIQDETLAMVKENTVKLNREFSILKMLAASRGGKVL